MGALIGLGGNSPGDTKFFLPQVHLLLLRLPLARGSPSNIIFIQYFEVIVCLPSYVFSHVYSLPNLVIMFGT